MKGSFADSRAMNGREESSEYGPKRTKRGGEAVNKCWSCSKVSKLQEEQLHSCIEVQIGRQSRRAEGASSTAQWRS
jgi:hypothetical protein